MVKLDSFIDHLESQVANHSIYVWAAQGEDSKVISEKWIKKMETSTTNAQRAINFWKKQCDLGYKNVLKAFDCSGLGMYALNKLFGYKDTTADGMYKSLSKKISRSDLKRGDWVFKVDSSGKATHIGYVVDKSLNVIEAKGRDDGVVKRHVDEGEWNAFTRPYCFESDILAAYETPKQPVKVGDLVSIASNATYWDGSHIPDWVKKQNWYVFSRDTNGRIVINENETKTEAIRSPIAEKYLTVVKGCAPTPAPTPTFKPYEVKVTAQGLNYRAGPGAGYKINGTITDRGIYTIVDEQKDAAGQPWGKLKSGAGWINLSYTKRL